MVAERGAIIRAMSKRRSAGSNDLLARPVAERPHDGVGRIAADGVREADATVPNTGEAEIRQALLMRLGQLFPGCTGRTRLPISGSRAA